MKIITLVFLFTLNLSARDSLKVIPKESFEMNSIEVSSNDSLVICSCGDFVYYPFGRMDKALQLSSSVLNIFVIHPHLEEMDNGKFLFYTLKYKSSRLLLFFDNDTEACTSSYVLKGDIVDSSVVFSNNVRIGMSKAAFLLEFFKFFPKEKMNKYKTIIFETCVAGTRQIYSFKNNRLSRISIINLSHWRLHY